MGPNSKKMVDNPNYVKNPEPVDCWARKMEGNKEKPTLCHQQGVPDRRSQGMVLLHLLGHHPNKTSVLSKGS